MFKLTKPYQRQLLSLTPAFLVMICGGMQLAFGVFNIFGYFSWLGKSATALYFVPASFHFASIIGVIVSSLIYNRFDILKIHYTNCCLMLIASIVVTSVPEYFASVLISRFSFGLGFGSSYITSIIHASEISSPHLRAHFIFLLHIFLTFGMFVFSLFTLSVNFLAIPRLIGSFSIGFLLLSVAVGFFCLKSSHVFMMQNNSKDALERFQYFQFDDTGKTHAESEALQTYVIEEKKRRFDFFSRHNISAVIVILFVEIGYLSVFNALHNYYRAVYLSAYLTVGARNYSLMITMGTRLIGSVSGFFILDRVAKKLQYAISAVIISSLLFSFGIFLYVYDYELIYIWIPMVFFIPVEFFVGFGLSPIADILKGELFPLKEKPISIATVLIFSEIFHCVSLIFLHTWIFSLGSFITSRILSFVFGGLTMVCGISIFVFLKDSRKQSLRTVADLYSY